MKKIVLLCAFFWSMQSLHAASVVMQLDPQNPAPYSKVTIRLISYDMNIDVSTVIWKVNGKEVERGQGIRTFTVTTGATGVSIPVSAAVSDSRGNSVVANINIVPQHITLLWEAIESYVPPFYEGRALPAPGSQVKVVAVPDTKRDPATLSYSWYVSDNFLPTSSGAGKQSAIIPLDTLTDETSIKVQARSADGVTMEKTISILPHEVMPLLYPYDEILGTLPSVAFSNRAELVGDITLSLEPYYLSTKRGFGSSAAYTWYIDNLPVTPPEQTLLSLKPKENSYGVRTLSITVEHARRILQQAEINLQLVFDTRK